MIKPQVQQCHGTILLCHCPGQQGKSFLLFIFFSAVGEAALNMLLEHTILLVSKSSVGFFNTLLSVVEH